MEENIKQVLKKAEKIVLEADIAIELRSVAFGEAFRSLWNIEKTVGERNDKSSLADKKTLKKAGARVNSPALLIDKMIEEGYFAIKRKDIECQAELKILGFNIPRKQLATVLLRKRRAGLLKRELSSDGGYVYFA